VARLAVGARCLAVGPVCSRLFPLLFCFSVQTAPSSAITFLIYESTIKLLHAEPAPKKSKFD